MAGHGRSEAPRPTPVAPTAALAFYRDTQPAFVRALPWFGRRFVKLLFTVAGPEVLKDPVAAAAGHPVFELHVGASQATNEVGRPVSP